MGYPSGLRVRSTVTNSVGSGITAIELLTDSAPIAPGTSVNLKLAGGSFHVPLEDESGIWWFDCTDNSVVWNAADEPLITGIGGAAVAGEIANGSRVAAIGDSTQRFRLNGVTSDGPLIYRSVGAVTIVRPEGATVYEVAIAAGGVTIGSFTVPLQPTAPDPDLYPFWRDNTGGGMRLNASGDGAWFQI